MKKQLIISFILFFLLFPLFQGCGGCHKWKERVIDYETLSGKEGELFLYSGGVLIERFSKVEIIYSSSDTESFIFEIKINGKKQKRYWQGEAQFIYE